MTKFHCLFIYHKTIHLATYNINKLQACSKTLSYTNYDLISYTMNWENYLFKQIDYSSRNCRHNNTYAATKIKS